MRVVINGEKKDVPAELNLQALLEHLSLPTKRVAVELNRQVVRRADWETRPVNEEDRIEVIHLVGGG
jgi:thiamine biosynthesis protein ThiS